MGFIQRLVAINVRDDTTQEERQVSCVQSPGNHRHRRVSWIKRERIPRRKTHRPAEKVGAWRPQGKIILGTGHSVECFCKVT